MPNTEQEWIPVTSSNVAQVRYDNELHAAYVQFNSGSVYRYDGVPLDVFDALVKAESTGKYVNLVLKRYDAVRV